MKIYTKKGDSGETGLVGNVRVPKDHLKIHAYGTFDELNAMLGVVIARGDIGTLRDRLLRVQHELFQLGAELATPHGKSAGIELISDQHTAILETEIDGMEEKLEPLKTFILPGGTETSALLHFARTVSRRAERDLITLHREDPLRGEVLRYVNRLSDYLFVCARTANRESGKPDVPWVAPHRK